MFSSMKTGPQLPRRWYGTHRVPPRDPSTLRAGVDHCHPPTLNLWTVIVPVSPTEAYVYTCVFRDRRVRIERPAYARDGAYDNALPTYYVIFRLE